jgi:cyclophilin family peptidyl-prolyl cis-trans isomerase
MMCTRRPLQLLLVFALPLLLVLHSCNADKRKRVKISTPQGDITVVLFDQTPVHSQNFYKLAKEGFYNGTLFHRVINGFMIQGGDPDSKNSAPDMMLGMGGPGYTLPAEIGRLHFKGALCAARDGNPEKRSSGSQFYIVHGKQLNDYMLDQMELMKKIKYTPQQRTLYKEKGGTPMLDNEYTVFGEVVEGLDVLDKIASVQTGSADRPTTNVPMTVKVLN